MAALPECDLTQSLNQLDGKSKEYAIEFSVFAFMNFMLVAICHLFLENFPTKNTATLSHGCHRPAGCAGDGNLPRQSAHEKEATACAA